MSLPEAFNPRVKPELALQTYEYFGGDPHRAVAIDRFVAGNDTHLRMEYPLLTREAAELLVSSLADSHARAEREYGEGSATATSVQYRLEEAQFLGIAASIYRQQAQDRLIANDRLNSFAKANDRLYGAPTEESLIEGLVEASAAYRDNDDPRVRQLWAELFHGQEVVLQNQERVYMPSIGSIIPLVRPETLTPAVSDMLRREWRLFAGPFVEAHSLVAEMIAVERGMKPDYDKKDIAFEGRHLYQAFRIGSLMMAQIADIEPFAVELDPNGSVASWQTARHAIVVGQKRATSMSCSTARGVLAHEATHGYKAAMGSQSHEPALATGVFTVDSKGRWVSYLDFEEGNNRLGEQVLREDEPEKPVVRHAYPIIAGLVYHRGYDDRQVFETYKRLRAIELLSHSPELTLDKAMQRAGVLAASKVQRLFRGTPIGSRLSAEGRALLYTKDLGYQRGTKKAIAFWNRVGRIAEQATDPQAHIHEVFERQNQGKVDPSEPDQAKLVGL